ncbi:UNVERIFIED_CONTAM: hypothetical protein HDU68_007619 [Siphonaria sp. JEL0065]|nr:hypothetical protein HDU68_007619 [Siphonaria sp. JEL0065]
MSFFDKLIETATEIANNEEYEEEEYEEEVEEEVEEEEEYDEEEGEEEEGEGEEEAAEEEDYEDEEEEYEDEQGEEEEEVDEEAEEEEYEIDSEEFEDRDAVELPAGWTQQFSNEYNCFFYSNISTGETQWHAPGTIPPPTVGGMAGAKSRDPYQMQHSFRGTGNKKALIIGINYAGTDSELSGCINDAQNLKEFICQSYGYNASPESMLMLLDDSSDSAKLPTFKNMLAGFVWLVSNTKPGDELFLSYSGHGGQIEDDDGGKYIKVTLHMKLTCWYSPDRESGLDCTLCPMDCDSAGQIRSDELHRYLVAALPEGVKLTVVMDCCHSGTVMELPYTYRPDANGKMSPIDILKKGMTIAVGVKGLLQGGFSMDKVNEAKRLFAEAQGLAAAFKDEAAGDSGGYQEESFNENSGAPKMVFCLSGCRDEQTSADTSFNGKASGALTYAILSALRANMNLSYEELLVQLREFMKGEYSQIPQLSCGIAVDPNSPFSF